MKSADAPPTPINVSKYRFLLIVGLINLLLMVFIAEFQAVEQDWGLQKFYRVKTWLHPPSPPKNIVDIEIDHATFLQLPDIKACTKKLRGVIDIRCFSRQLHADLISKLNRHGAKLIVFNLLFRESRADQDRSFAEALRQAGNVLLQDYQERRFIGSGVEIVDVTPPVAPLSDNAASAPLPIPQGNGATPRLWLFLNLIHEAQDSAQSYIQPVLPVVALNLWVLQQYSRELIATFNEVSPQLTAALTTAAPDYNDRAVIHTVIDNLSRLFEDNTQLGPQLSSVLASHPEMPIEAKSALQSLFALYQIDKDFYLNPYGPTGTIPTIAYQRVDQSLKEQPELFKDKVVFIGPSRELGRPTKGGVIDTPYGEISSTELLATVFANLRDAQTLNPASDALVLAIAVVWWLIILTLLSKLRVRFAVFVLFGLSLAYLSAAFSLFLLANLLLPWLVILLQSLMAIVAALINRYLKQRGKLTDILNASLPSQLFSMFSKADFAAMKHGINLQGVCMAADGEGYTKLGESKGEQWLANFMLAFQPLVEHCVRQHQGSIKDWAGDGMVALWTEAPHPAKPEMLKRLTSRRPQTGADDIRQQALHAALTLQQDVSQFNQLWNVHFPLRIGISYGSMWFSFVDELKVFGDTLNTASRIEALNKQLHTRILVTEEVAAQQSDFVFRRVGYFQLRGHKHWINIYELMGLIGHLDAQTLTLISKFERGLKQYEAESRSEAAAIFSALLTQFPEDGPTRYYYQQCLPPGD